MSESLVLLSGGQDSTTCLYWALKTYSRVEALGFDYGQKHAIELECAKVIAGRVGVPFTQIPLSGVFGGSALVDFEQDVSARHRRNADLPASFTAGRNAVFLSVAAGVAYERGIHHIIGGMCQTDYSGYPDCRQAFIDAMEAALSLALDWRVKILTPLMNRTKAETWKLAADLGCLDVIIEDTHTDYNGDRETLNDWGYGKTDNPASALRAKGYDEAKHRGWI